jgi:hypothetical protein
MTESLLLQQWIKSLRAGHSQGEKYLRYFSGNCMYYSALGLYCNLLIKRPDAFWKRVPFGQDAVFRFCMGDQESTFFPSPEVLECSGLDFSIFLYVHQLNDNGWTFADIADEMEQSFPNINKASGIFIPEAPSHVLVA